MIKYHDWGNTEDIFTQHYRERGLDSTVAEQHNPEGMAKSSYLEQQAGLRKNKQTNTKTLEKVHVFWNLKDHPITQFI